MHDIKQALRTFRNSPVFAVTAVLVIAIGIGANVAIFSVVNAVILRPVPYEDPDTLVQLMNGVYGGPTSSAGSPARYLLWREQTEVVEDVAAYGTVALNFTRGDMPERVAASRVSAPYFRTFRVPIEQGRAFTADEDLPGAPPTAVVSYGFWMNRLGGAADVIGSALSFGSVSYTVLGVVSPRFDTRELGGIDVWLPLQLDPSVVDHSEYFQVAARLKPGVSIEQARARIAATAAVFEERYASALNPGVRFTVVPFQEAIVGSSARSMLWTLAVAVSFVLLIACANVANLLLARASGRGRDIAIRSALGAGRWRIVRQLLTESALLAAVGAALGLVGGFAGMRALLAINTAGLPRLGEAGALLGMDWRVVAFAVAIAVATIILFGLVPAVVASRTDLGSVMKASSSRAGSGLGQDKTRSVLVVAEIGLAVVLLIGAGLLIRTSLALGSADPGLNVDNVLVMRTPLSEPKYRTTAGVQELFTGTLDRIRGLPNVEAATVSSGVPLTPGFGFVFNVVGRVQDRPFTGGGSFFAVTDGFFEAFEIPVLRGRVFEARDDARAPPAVVISRSVAERWWPEGEDPLQDRMLIGGGSTLYPTMADEPIRQIIGVVEDMPAVRLTDPPRPTIYVPQAQMTDLARSFDGETDVAWVVRTSADPLELAPVIASMLRQATGAPVTDVQTMAQILSLSISRQRANATLMAVFGGAALLLAAIGIYGLMAFSVQQRTHEIGIRLALGAQRDRVRGMVIRQGLALIAIGTALGLGAAYVLADLLASVLFGVEPRDAAVFTVVPLLLATVAAAAVSVPAHRASRVSPLDALRCE
jgi:predicted permease